jgi:gluconolactonase
MSRRLLICLLLSSLAAADFDIVDQAAFKRLFNSDAKVERMATGMQFVEGPVWMADGFLVFSDIPANQLNRWDAQQGVQTFRQPSNNANGNTLDREGRLITAEHGARRVSRTNKDGTVETIADKFDGKSLNSPNDVIVKSNGDIWFTDPDYGLAGRPKEMSGNYVFRVDPDSKLVALVARGFDQPNGLCFSPDESKLYVADSGKPHNIRLFNISREGGVSGGSVFATIDPGAPDGIRCDEGGRVWASSGDGVQIFGPDGKLIARILLPEAAANLTFGGPAGRTLYITARKSLYAVETRVRAARRR